MSEIGNASEETNPRKDFLRRAVTLAVSSAALATTLVEPRLNKPLPKEKYLTEITIGDKKAKVGMLMGWHEGDEDLKSDKRGNWTEFKESDIHQPTGAFFFDSPLDYLDPRTQKL